MKLHEVLARAYRFVCDHDRDDTTSNWNVMWLTLDEGDYSVPASVTFWSQIGGEETQMISYKFGGSLWKFRLNAKMANAETC